MGAGVLASGSFVARSVDVDARGVGGGRGEDGVAGTGPVAAGRSEGGVNEGIEGVGDGFVVREAGELER